MNIKKKSGITPSERFAKIIFFISTATSIIALGFIIYFIFSNAIPKIMDVGLLNFIGGKEWRPTFNPPKFGILPMILASIYTTLGAVALGVSFGVLVAIFMAFYAPKKLYNLLKAGINLLAGIPSVVYGLFGVTLIAPWVSKTFGGIRGSLLSVIIVLVIMILPTIISLSESALRAVPKHYFQGAVGLGASKERAIFNVVLPAAKSGVFASIILGVGRAIGETMAVQMVSGNQPIIPKSLLQGGRTMTANIVVEMGYASADHKAALLATGAVLFFFILLINIAFNIAKNREASK